MKKFVLFWFDGTTSVVEARNIAEAVQNSGTMHLSMHLTSYEVNGKTVQVSAQAHCGCVYHAEQGLSCEHDLKLAGLW